MIEHVLIRVNTPESSHIRLGQFIAEALSSRRVKVSTQGFLLPGVADHGILQRILKRRRITVEIGLPKGKADLVILVAPEIERAQALLERDSAVTLVVLDGEVQEALGELPAQMTDRVAVLPFPVPDEAYAPGHGKVIFDVAQRLRLERRPRLLYGGSYHDGRALTLTLNAAKELLYHDGEMIMIHGVEARPQLAPIVKKMGLSERVIFTPILPEADILGLLHNADVLIIPDGGVEYSLWAHYAMAAGLPTVMTDTLSARSASARSALMVDSRRDDAWPDAIRDALTNGVLRERMMQRGLSEAISYRMDQADTVWWDFFEERWG